MGRAFWDTDAFVKYNVKPTISSLWGIHCPKPPLMGFHFKNSKRVRRYLRKQRVKLEQGDECQGRACGVAASRARMAMMGAGHCSLNVGRRAGSVIIMMVCTTLQGLTLVHFLSSTQAVVYP